MQKIAIIGSGGAGKSTLAKQIGTILNLPVYHLDAYFWKPGWEPIPKKELISYHQEIFQQDGWIIDGNYSSTMEMRLQAADTVIFLDYSTIRCLYGIIKRRFQYRGKTRPDMGKGCPERLDPQFVLWVARYKQQKAPIVKQKLRNAGNITIYHLKKPRHTKDFLTQLERTSTIEAESPSKITP
ncbi:DNA topology modulation protein [Sediminibacillus massiliensis]|uniref:DNA topology modulation protein n=1 Tax=Sediminibacillus massiliensis TaxID=1926277 RepID=UPI0009885048|nr:DNA topology modulation protein [Sediminibacillus massiliensis]